MSSAIEAVPAKSEKTTSDWSLWLRQIGAIFRMEIEKNFLGRRAILIYLLAFLPLFPLMILALFTPPGNEWQDFNNYSLIYSGLYNALILRTVVFFGSAWIFMNLFRGDIVDRSLHYYFLSAVRREVLVVGKYFSGLVTSIVLFTSYDGHRHAAALLSAFLLAELALLHGRTRVVANPHVCGYHDARVCRLWRFLSGSGTVCSQPDYSGAGALRVGVDQFLTAAVVEKDQRDSLSQLAGARAA